MESENKKKNNDRMREYWRTHPEAYDKHKEKVKEYQKTVRGQEITKKSHSEFNEQNPSYYSEYMKNWRTNKKNAGLCISCGKRKVQDNRVTCTVCIEKMNNRRLNGLNKYETLHVPIRRDCFDLIARDIKKVKYLNIKPYWDVRLMEGEIPIKYEKIRFTNSLGQHKPIIEVEHLGVNKEKYNGELHYALKLGKILKIENYEKLDG